MSVHTRGLSSLLPRPPLAAFFAAVEKRAGQTSRDVSFQAFPARFSTAAKKAARGGLGMRLRLNHVVYTHSLLEFFIAIILLLLCSIPPRYAHTLICLNAYVPAYRSPQRLPVACWDWSC